ncbi:MAG: hypothetical protein K2X99_00580 [Gemmatimonadaceae bacterium]|nr:hypothetical protein [Gemmatimonadaceae bacterium]
MAPRLAALLLLVLGFVPWATLLPGGEQDRAWWPRLLDHANGTLICAGVGFIAWMLVRRRAIAWRMPRLPTVPLWGVMAGAFALYVAIAWGVLSHRPLLIDEIVQLWQARVYASGALSLPTERYPEFRSILHVVDVGARTYSQFPPGGPAFLALGVLVGAPWIVGPAFGALSVGLMGRLARGLAAEDAEDASAARFGVATAALFAVTPFVAFMAASHMNHVTALWALLVSAVALQHHTREHAPHAGVGSAFVVGTGLGIAATVRPLDAFAFAIPSAIWLLVRARRSPRHLMALLASGVGVALPFAAMMYVNAETTGAPLRFGYDVLWGSAHGLGFHAAPWGAAHTPMRGIELLSLYATRLQSYLFELPVPSLLFPAAALWLSRGALRAMDRYLLASAALLLASYGAYWHDGFFLGPRFVYPLAPVLVLWTARLPRLLAPRLSGPVRIGVLSGVAAALVLAITANLPLRVAQYRNGLTSMRVDYARLARDADATGGLIFVRESWGAQLMARLWALGVSRPASAAYYRGIDACALDGAIAEAERSAWSSAALEARLQTLLADSAKLVASPVSPDTTERALPGSVYPARCSDRIMADRGGYTHLAPTLVSEADGTRWLRDLGDRNRLAVEADPQRSPWLLLRDGAAADARFRLVRLSRDSMLRAELP